MAYDEEEKPVNDSLCLYGPLAQDFMRTPIGETVKLTVTAILKRAGLESSSSEDEHPCVEFEVLDVEGGKKPYDEMSPGEMDAEIYNVKSEDQPERSNVPNREDGGSIWTDVARQSKANRKPMRRPKPFAFR
jgi:hypothetical protein